MKFADNEGPDQPAHKADQGLHGPLTESMDTVVYADEQRCSDQTARMLMLIWTYVMRKLYKGLFRTLRTKYIYLDMLSYLELCKPMYFRHMI